ncbi:hypothetical protein [Geobacter sp. AOG1]|uniref:hypothetical protein n=1 Tax=Geobacter sp. AOG1 TaxID=1566346 RepID=UPI001CC41D19|nr:hypothetical protein [Geobacter sp. AOG1]GFE56784.1 membrane protein [Geobacter sp. AOG1]
MRINKKCLAVLAAAACVAATAVPALALENEFHGMFRLFSAVNNFNATPITDGFYLPEGQDKKPGTATYIAQRARLMYIAKANDDLKLVTHFEIDSRWGDNSYGSNGTTRNNGGAIGADQVNLETKSVYLDFNIPKTPLNVKLGMQPFDDSFKGVFVGADMAGALASASYGKFNSSIGFFRFNDNGPNLTPKVLPGKQTRDMLVVDEKYAVSKEVKVGGAYYMVNDDRSATNSIFHTLGVNGEAAFGPVTVDGFLIYQFGNLESNPANRQHLSAFAGNVGARAKVGTGTARTEFLYVSGEGNPGSRGTSNAFQSIDDEHGFYNGNMQLLFRDAYSMTIDNAVVYTSNNLDRGVIAGFVGYDMPFTSKLSGSANAGFAAVAKDTGFAGHRKSNYLGTELNAQADYKLYDNLTATLRGAYVILGDYYEGVAANGQDPQNPYMASFMMNYSF